MSRIRYLNTDLDLKSLADLTPLVTGFEAYGWHALYVTQDADGSGFAVLECALCSSEPADTITAMLDGIDALAPELHSLWQQCHLREFNIGYLCGDEPASFQQALSRELLGRIVAVGASLRFTLYPSPQNSTESSAPTGNR